MYFIKSDEIHIQIVQTDRTLVKIGYKTLYIKNRIKIKFK